MARSALILALAAAACFASIAQAQYRKPASPKKPTPAAAIPDANEILKSSRSAILTTKTAMYNARIEPYGSAEKRLPTTTAIVAVQRMITGSPVMARVSVRGEVKRPNDRAGKPMHFVYDGQSMRWMNADGTVEEAEPGKDGGQGALLAREELRVVPLDLILAEPLTHIIDTATVAYEGRKSVEGTECDVILLDYTPAYHANPAEAKAVKERWYIASEDGLPRKIEWPLTGAGAGDGGTALTLAQLQPNAPLEPAIFKIAGPAASAPAGPKPPALKPRDDRFAVGEVAPDWALREASGEEHRLSEFKGKVVVLDFWATWCTPCTRVMPEIQALHEKYSGRGAMVIGISTYEGREPVEGPQRYMKRQKFTYGLLVEGDTVARGYGAHTIPTLYVIGKDGKVLFSSSGAAPGDLKKIDQIIEKELRPGK